jgi:4a-hydroxytetrahydrobiopterin dehydratase
MAELTQKHCVPCEGGTPPLSAEKARTLLGELDDWTLNDEGTEIGRTFRFKNFHRTMEFVNALAWIAHREDHHPDLEVGYNRCHVRFSTHAIGGLSENDFICAAKVDALLQ